MTPHPAAAPAQGCTCGASTDGKWADVHDARCPAVAHVKTEQQLIDGAWERFREATVPAQGEPTQAPRHSKIGDAYATFILALMGNRPRELQIENSDGALADRVCQIDSVIIACKDYLKALVEDTARNVALAKRPDDIVDSHMTDLASDLRGHFLQAMERNAA